MALKHTIRQTVQRLGFDIVRYPLREPLARTVQLMQSYNVANVIDVGANDGGFASSIRKLGYSGRIMSFEPLPHPFEKLNLKASADQNWDVFQYAIGDSDGNVTINVSGNSGLSSSVLPMLDSHLSVAPGSQYVSKETVVQKRLDSIYPLLGLDADTRTFLKVDVQGYESAVLDGASELFANKLIHGLQLELSLTALYAGGMTYREGLERAEAFGLSLMGLDPVFCDPKTGRLLQVDAVFFLEGRAVGS